MFQLEGFEVVSACWQDDQRDVVLITASDGRSLSAPRGHRFFQMLVDGAPETDQPPFEIAEPQTETIEPNTIEPPPDDAEANETDAA